MKCPKRKTFDKKHEWVAPEWFRQHFDGRIDLELVCKHCGIISGISNLTSDTARDLEHLFGLTINSAKFLRLERWNGGK